MRNVLTLLIVAGWMSGAQAGENNQTSGSGAQDPFLKNREIKLQSYREKISLMQDSLACIQAAKSFDSVQTCEARERSAMEEHSRRMKERWEALKQQ